MDSRIAKPTIKYKMLDILPARCLTSREISKIISSLLFGFSTFCDPKEIIDAIEHFHVHLDDYRSEFEAINFVANNSEFEDNPPRVGEINK